MMVLSGDVGGTKVNLAYYALESGKLTRVLLQTYPSRKFDSLSAIVRVFLREHPASLTGAAIGIAGPVDAGRSTLTNLGWDVDAADLARDLRLEQVALLNDLEATAYGTLRLEASDAVLLQEGRSRSGGAIAVIAAGTGLGEGGLVWDGSGYRALPSEGGHVDFAPRDELEMDLLRFLMQDLDHISYERILSGPGLSVLYRFFRSRSSERDPRWLTEALVAGNPSAVISAAGLERRDTACIDALDLFVSLYGAEAGNLALKIFASGGVYVAGGIAPKIIAKIQEGGFLTSFLDKGRHRGLLEQIPLRVVLDEHTALTGAAHYAALLSRG
jgi:glucokinase